MVKKHTEAEIKKKKSGVERGKKEKSYKVPGLEDWQFESLAAFNDNGYGNDDDDYEVTPKSYEKDLNLKEFLKKLGCSENTFRKNMERICSNSVYDIDEYKFKRVGKEKEDISKGDMDYVFKKEWVDLAYVLFQMFEKNPYYRSNVNPNNISIEKLVEYNREYLEVTKELSVEHRINVEGSPEYIATIMEAENISIVVDKMNALQESISKAPVTVRSWVWDHINKEVNKMIINTQAFAIYQIENLRKSPGETFSPISDKDYNNRSLDEYIAKYLKSEMDGECAERDEMIKQRVKPYIKDMDKVSKEAEERDGKEMVDYINKRWEELGIQSDIEKCKLKDILYTIEMCKRKAIKDIRKDNYSIYDSLGEEISNLEAFCDVNKSNSQYKSYLKALKTLEEQVEKEKIDLDSKGNIDDADVALMRKIGFKIWDRN